MSLAVLGRIALGVTRYRVTGRRVPLTAYLSITNRCDALCAHCAVPMRAQKELSTPELLALVGTLADRGCQAVVITGGEPLARRDVTGVVARCAARGLHVTVESNGYRYPELADALPIDELAVSVDGDEAAHDTLREPGSHARAEAALAEAALRGVRRATVTVLTRDNLGTLDAVLSLAERHGARARFRLLHHNEALDGGASCDLAPTDAEIRRALRWLIEARRRGRPVDTPEKTLRTLLAWDDYRRPTSPLPREDQLCAAGQTHLFVDADGSVYPCRQRVGMVAALDVRTVGFDAAFDQLRGNECQACAAAELCEKNHLDNLNVPTLLGVAYNERRRLASRRERTRTVPG